MSHIDVTMFINHLTYMRPNSSAHTGSIVQNWPGLAPALEQPIAKDKKALLSGWGGRSIKYFCELVQVGGMWQDIKYQLCPKSLSLLSCTL